MGDYLTPNEVAQKYKVSRVTIWSWRKSGLPYLTNGQRVLFDRQALEKWYEENRAFKKVNYDN